MTSRANQLRSTTKPRNTTRALQFTNFSCTWNGPVRNSVSIFTNAYSQLLKWVDVSRKSAKYLGTQTPRSRRTKKKMGRRSKFFWPRFSRMIQLLQLLSQATSVHRKKSGCRECITHLRLSVPLSRHEFFALVASSFKYTKKDSLHGCNIHVFATRVNAGRRLLSSPWQNRAI